MIRIGRTEEERVREHARGMIRAVEAAGKVNGKPRELSLAEVNQIRLAKHESYLKRLLERDDD